MGWDGTRPRPGGRPRGEGWALWWQVSDQLVEINGNSTAGMTHSQAVEQIRRGGHRIHLVLKRGNGYVPDYGEKVPVCPRR